MNNNKNKLKGNEIYTSPIRTLTVLFGSLFNNIHIRYYNTDGSIRENEDYLVPIQYRAKSSYAYFVDQLMRQPTGTIEIGKRFPRITYELMGFQRDDQRALNVYTPIYSKKITKDGKSYSVRAPIAYVFSFSLSIWAKDMDTSLQILDQILPMFAPDISIKFLEDKKMTLVNDVQVVLNGVQKDDTWSSQFQEQRVINWEMDFSVFADIIPNVSDENVIQKVITNVEDLTASYVDKELTPTKLEVTTSETVDEVVDPLNLFVK